jgi:RNA polymerase sigma-70 factor (ECF subfamily)
MPRSSRRPSARRAGGLSRGSAAEQTDWPQIAALYTLLLRLHPSPVVALNRAAAVAMGERLERGLGLIEGLAGELQGFHLLPAAKADILRRMGRYPEAAAAYGRALRLVTHEAERRYLERRLREVDGGEPRTDRRPPRP